MLRAPGKSKNRANNYLAEALRTKLRGTRIEALATARQNTAHSSARLFRRFKEIPRKFRIRLSLWTRAPLPREN